MSVKTLFDVLEEVEALSGTNDKIRVLMLNKDIENLALFLKLAIDDRIVFNVKKLPEYALMGGSCTFATFISLCEKLSCGALSGKAAQEEIKDILEHATPVQNKWYRKCLQKDMASSKIGVHIVNKVWPGLVLDFECMLAQPEDKIKKADFTNGGYLDLKQNGVRTFFFLNAMGEVHTPDFLKFPGFQEAVPFARSGLPIDNFAFLNARVEKLGLKNMVIDCECHVDQVLEDAMTVYGFEYRNQEHFIGAKGKLKDKAWKDYEEKERRCDLFRSKMKVAIIDILTLEEWLTKTCKRTEEERKAFISRLSLVDGVERTPTEFVKDMDGASEAAKKHIKNNLEGGIYKPRFGLYEWKCSYNWIKIKEEVESDVVILGVYKAKQTYDTNGKPEPPMAGGVECTDGKRFFRVGTGKGWDKEFYQKLLENEEEYKQKVMKITAQRVTEDSYICPRADVFRPDKLARDILGE